MVCWILNRNRLISHLSPRERCHFWSSGNQDIFGLYYFWTSILLMYCNLDNKTIPITAYFQATKINAHQIQYCNLMESYWRSHMANWCKNSILKNTVTHPATRKYQRELKMTSSLSILCTLESLLCFFVLFRVRQHKMRTILNYNMK